MRTQIESPVKHAVESSMNAMPLSTRGRGPAIDVEPSVMWPSQALVIKLFGIAGLFSAVAGAHVLFAIAALNMVGHVNRAGGLVGERVVKQAHERSRTGLGIEFTTSTAWREPKAGDGQAVRLPRAP